MQVDPSAEPPSTEIRRNGIRRPFFGICDVLMFAGKPSLVKIQTRFGLFADAMTCLDIAPRIRESDFRRMRKVRRCPKRIMCDSCQDA